MATTKRSAPEVLLLMLGALMGARDILQQVDAGRRLSNSDVRRQLRRIQDAILAGGAK